MTWKAKLKALGPCPEAYKWACQYNTLRQAWRACERGDWMRWLLVELGNYQEELNATVEVYCEWIELDYDTREEDLVDAYIILDFMPDPPELP